MPPFAVAPLLAGSTLTTVVGAFQPGTSSVVYMADQDEAGVQEPYIHEILARPPHHRSR